MKTSNDLHFQTRNTRLLMRILLIAKECLRLGNFNGDLRFHQNQQQHNPCHRCVTFALMVGVDGTPPTK